MRGKANRYFLLYKPYGVHCRFSAVAGGQNTPTLQSLYNFPKDVYSLGRLDADSEGLLLLTNDSSLNYRLLNPHFAHRRTYWVQVEGVPDAKALRQLYEGVTITVNHKPYHTQPAVEVALLQETPVLPVRYPPVRYRANIPTAWLQLTLTEGKNRQVRSMAAAVGYPVLRLVRIAIEQLRLGTLQPGQVKEISENTVYRALFNRPPFKK
ncbi:pseudouridine synthase [Sphingobacteriales bacterium UPWRP_1]|nr:pseudouridine synthase [Sphingobacteriales bacterium TSM_CSM]PSJ76356.1 pseudouridine synthase [Sphingobacteriales bacterium UPWRP_1]